MQILNTGWQMGESRGLGADEASFLISMIGITNTIGRVISGWITDIPCISPLVVNLVATIVSKWSCYMIITISDYFNFRHNIPSSLVTDL